MGDPEISFVPSFADALDALIDEFTYQRETSREEILLALHEAVDTGAATTPGAFADALNALITAYLTNPQAKSPLGSQSPLVAKMTAGDACIGYQIQINNPGEITALKYWREITDPVTSRNIAVWSNAGVKLGEITTVDEVDGGWLTFPLDPPIAVAAADIVRVVYDTTAGSPRGETLATPSDISEITILASCFGSPSTFPDGLYVDANFWVDVVYQQTDYNAEMTEAIRVLEGQIGTTTGAPPPDQVYVEEQLQ